MFGNETKHRRGKVSLKLFEEVAYFQSVRGTPAYFLLISPLFILTEHNYSFQMPSMTGTYNGQGRR